MRKIKTGNDVINLRKKMKTKNILLIILLVLISKLNFAQTAPDTLWTKTFGGNGDDFSYSIQQTSDSGFIITGDYNASYPGNVGNIYLIKIDQHGDTIWTKTYGGSLGDYGLDVIQTGSNGYAITGYTHSFGTHNRDAYLFKVNANGDSLWLKTYGVKNWNASHSIHQTTDGGFILAGETSFGSANDWYVIRTDSNGTLTWERTFGGVNTEWADNAFQTPDGGFLISGTTNSFGAGGFDFYLIRVNSSGDTMWTKTYGGSGDDWTSTSLLTSDNGMLIGGATSSFGNGQEDIYLIRTDANGDILWTKTYGGPGTEWASSISQLTSDGFIIVGQTNSFGYGNDDVYVLRINSNGDTLWTQTYGGSNNDCGRSVKQTSNGGFAIAGYSSSFGSGDYDVYLIQTQPDLASGIIGYMHKILPEDLFIAQNYPNPFNPTTKIKYFIPVESFITLKVYDILGSEIVLLVNEKKAAGEYEIEFDGTKLPSGIYFYKLKTLDFNKTKKMILMR